jgi:hypothetical protein
VAFLLFTIPLKIKSFKSQTRFGISDFDHCDFPFDFAQDRQPVERLVEPFDIYLLQFGI